MFDLYLFKHLVCSLINRLCSTLKLSTQLGVLKFKVEHSWGGSPVLHGTGTKIQNSAA